MSATYLSEHAADGGANALRARASFFITGTDTEVGKTVSSCALLHAFAARGCSTVAMKPIAAGAAWHDGRWRNDDAELLAAAATTRVAPELATPYLLRAAAAPHLAAAAEGVTLDIAQIVRCYAQLAPQADVTVVEGVGGFCVPLDARHDTADLAVALGLPVVLVVGVRLGCLSHALLSAAAIVQRGLRLAGWIANRIDPAMAFASENIDTLQHRFDAAYGAPLLGTVPSLASPSGAAAAHYLDVEPLLRGALTSGTLHHSGETT